jgi:hypothetical protein
MGAPDLLQHLRGAGFDLSLTADGGIKVTPASALADADRHAIRAFRAELLALLARGNGGDLPAQQHVNAADDDRVTCTGGCTHYRVGTCANYRTAGLVSPALGRDLANLLQRCHGFTEGKA